MNLSVIDWAIVVAYFALSMGIGILFTKKGGESIEEYFLSGRNVSWWLAGASMVATTFAADTPLVVTGLVFSNGVAGNWLWWNMLMSGMLTVFFFARLWRRAGVMTDVEFAELRYSGKPAAALRGFRAVYLALPINLIILGWVTKAMIKILTISLGLHPVNLLGFTVSGEVIAVGICFIITVAYSTGAGMWAVLWTDLVQFVIKMSAVIVLAVYAVRAVGGMDKLKTGLSAHFGSSSAAISVLPVQWTGGGIAGYTWMPLMTLAVFLSVQWWAAWYPGRRARRGRLRGAAHLLVEDGAGRRARDAVLQRGALRHSSMAVDHHGARDGAALSGGHRRGARSRGRVRAGVRRSAADAVARLHDGRLRRRVHVHRGNAAQLGRVVSRERFLQALPQQDRHGEALRRRLALGDGVSLPRVDLRDVAARHRGRAHGSCCSPWARAPDSCSSCAGTGGASTRGARSAR